MEKDHRFALVIVFFAALLLFSSNLNRPPAADELHHVLAAQHLIETGRPLIGNGEYQRGILHTWMVALSYELFGESVASARIPAVLLVALVAPILFFWVRREAGLLAAWLAAGLFILSPFTVEIAQFSRFYALQIFSFVLGVMCWYYTLVAQVPLSRRMLLGGLALALLYLSVAAQVTTFVGLVGLVVWTSGLLLHRIYVASEIEPNAKKFFTVALIIVSAIVIVAVSVTDVLQWAWNGYRTTQLFNADRQNEFWFYHLRFLLFYPTLWTLVGIIAVFAIAHSHRLAWLSICIFSISFLLMSFAGTKATRYLSFAPPFLAILWGIGLAGIMPKLSRYFSEARVRLIETFAFSQGHGVFASRIVVTGALAMVILTNPFWLRTATMIANVPLPTEVPATDWRAAREVLAPWARNVEIMITTEELGAIYFLGRSDVRFSPSKLRELARDQRKEFGIDYRTGRPVISKPESIQQLIECFRTGLIVGPVEHWGDPIRINEVIKEIIIEAAEQIEVPRESYLYAWGWEREPRENNAEYCAELERFSGR